MENKENLAKMTHCERVLWYIKTYGGITPLEAMRDLGIMRLGARIHDLKHKNNIDIKTSKKTVKNRFGDSSKVAYYYLEQ